MPDPSNVLFRIITNRSSSPHTQHLLHMPKGRREHEDFEEEKLRAILQNTEIIGDMDFAPFQQALRQFADDYGTDEDEYEQGVQKLIGMLVERATRYSDQPIREQDLIKAFRGHAPLQKLTVLSIREQTSRDRKDMMSMLGLQGMPVLRTRLVEEAMMRAKEHALLVFQGPGGSGKSVLAWHVLQSILEDRDETKCAPTAFLPLRDVQSLSWLVGEWMGMPEDKRNEPIEQVIRRIKIANPMAHPVLYLGIDGLDEKNEMMNGDVSLRQIVTWFWRRERALQVQRETIGRIEPPEATLIVTCRDRDLLSPLLGTSLSTEMKGKEGYTLSVEDYSPEELLDAVEQSMFPYLERFKQVMGNQLYEVSIFSQSPYLIGPPVHQETLKALYHSAMWYAFCRLSGEQQSSLLDGADQAFRPLANLFLEWFTIKVMRRRPGWEKEAIWEALEAVAALASQALGSQQPYRIWKDVGKQGCRFEGRTVSEDLYHESLSAGLIHEWEARKAWGWRHPFVGIYLAERAMEAEDGND